MEIKYGSAELVGYSYEDWVCIGQGYQTNEHPNCLQNFNFMIVSDNVGNKLQKGLDGILGLGPDFDSDKGPSLLQHLKTAGIINNSIASFNLADVHTSS